MYERDEHTPIMKNNLAARRSQYTIKQSHHRLTKRSTDFCGHSL